MSYTIKPVTQYAVINDATGQPIAVCKDKSEATAILNSMAGHGAYRLRDLGRPYTFTDWARH